MKVFFAFPAIFRQIAPVFSASGILRNSTRFYFSSRDGYGAQKAGLGRSESDTSKLSVFSPIMSSSRMELPSFSGKNKRRNSFLLSDHHSPPRELYPPLTEQSGFNIDGIDDKDDNPLEASNFATPVFPRTAKFEPFRLSPTIIGDVDGNSPTTVAATKTRRRESGLVQMMSQLERLNVGEFTPMAAERNRLRNRLDDLISTLSFSPTHNIDDDDDVAHSFFKIPDLPNFE